MVHHLIKSRKSPPTNVYSDIVRKADDYELKEWITTRLSGRC
jgi:hypothetical protein